MKKLLFFLIAISLIPLKGNAQDKDSKTISLENVKVVVIDAKDQTSIQCSHNNEINISCYLFKKGKIRGVKSPSERPEFSIEYEISEDTLYLSSPAYYSPLMIGISTYSERIETNIEIPSHIPVIVIESKHLVIKDLFSNVNVLQSDKIIYNNLKRSELSRLICIAKDKLLIDGINRSYEFEMEGSGKNQIRLLSKEIEINTID